MKVLVGLLVTQDFLIFLRTHYAALILSMMAGHRGVWNVKYVPSDKCSAPLEFAVHTGESALAIIPRNFDPAYYSVGTLEKLPWDISPVELSFQIAQAKQVACRVLNWHLYKYMAFYITKLRSNVFYYTWFHRRVTISATHETGQRTMRRVYNDP